MKNNRMKKICAALLALMMAVMCLTACGSGDDKATEATAAATEAKATEPTVAEATTVSVEVKEEKVIEKIPFSTKEEYSDEITEGESVVTRTGVEGEKEITYKVTYIDGKESAREKISEKVTKEPVDEIITHGTGSAADEVYEVGREDYPDCDGSGGGFIVIIYSDGSTECVDY